MKNVLEYLEAASARYGSRPAFEDRDSVLTWGQVFGRAREIGTALSRICPARSGVALCMPKGSRCIPVMLGALYAGCYYTVLDPEMPRSRMQLILKVFGPQAIVCGDREQALFSGLEDTRVLTESGIGCDIDDGALAGIRRDMTDTDLCYVLFTSGSTGVPKGVSIMHRSVIDLVTWAVRELKVDETFRFGNQAPLYFDNSVLDIYCAMQAGAAVHFIPKTLFLFPGKMMDYLEEHRINTLFWVPSALGRCATSGAVRDGRPRSVKHVFFCGEVMPVRFLNIWRESLPNADYVNMYGPTEICDVCMYYRVDRDFQENEDLPIGFPCDNTRILLLDGEICVGGTCLSAGYFGAPEKTTAAFIQNPLNPHTMEWIYKTGDLGRLNARGEMEFLGRRDSQIKRSGYRIELGEIETALLSCAEIGAGCCVYDAKREEIHCFYTGQMDEKALKNHLKALVPKYMLPDRYHRLLEMPLNGSGKADRAALKASLEEMIETGITNG